MVDSRRLDALPKLLAPFPGVLAWYLLGSAATGTMRADSDIDLAILPFPNLVFDRTELIRWGGELSLKLGCEVDIGVMDSGNLVYAKEALIQGKRLTCVDQGRADARAAELIALYMNFQDDRREVLDAYRA